MNKFTVEYVPLAMLENVAQNIGEITVSRPITIERRRTPRYDIEALLKTLPS